MMLMRKRSLAMVVILGLITFGIYQLYWLISTRKEMVQRGAYVPRVLILFLPLIALAVLALLQLLLQVGFSAVSAEGAPTATGPHILEIFMVTFAILAAIALIPVTFYWIYKYCQAAERVTGGQITTNFAFAMYALLTIFGVGFIWPAIVQDTFNKLSDANPPAAQQASSAV
jgi:hypothetical protein